MYEKKTKKEKEEEAPSKPRGEYIEVELDKLVPYTSLQGHVWVQEGPNLICNSCQVRHAFSIGMDKRLMGYDEEGNPIIKKV